MLDRDDGVKAQYCIKCKVEVFRDGDKCPLCGEKLFTPEDAIRVMADIEYLCSKMEQTARGIYA